MKWLLEKNVFPENENKIKEACLKLGHEFESADIKTIISQANKYNNRTIFYGSINGAILLSRENPTCQVWHKGFDFCNYYPYFYHTILNNMPVIVTFHQLINQLKYFYTAYGKDGIFIKSNSGFKYFPGELFKDYNILEANLKSTYLKPEELMIVHRGFNISTGMECRYLIVHGKVITGSIYLINNKIQENPIEIKNDNICKIIEEKVINKYNLNYPAYTIDLFYFPDNTIKSFSTIEINSFTCSGLYGMDMLKVVDSVSKALEEDLC